MKYLSLASMSTMKVSLIFVIYCNGNEVEANDYVSFNYGWVDSLNAVYSINYIFLSATCFSCKGHCQAFCTFVISFLLNPYIGQYLLPPPIAWV